MIIKQELKYHEGAYSAFTQILYMIDDLICESCHYRENDKLWTLRAKVEALRILAEHRIEEIKGDL